MQKKYFTKIIILLFVANFACTKPQVIPPYVLSNIPEIQNFERQDHEYCTSLKLNYDGGANRLYWNCRLSFAKFRLHTGYLSPQQQRNNFEVSDLIAKISLKLASSSENILSQENKKMDEIDHRKCLARGFVVDTEDLIKIDEYFACRKALIDAKQLIPAYGNSEYLKYNNLSYNIGYVIDQRILKNSQRYEELKAQYPNCIQYNYNGQNFSRCIAALAKSAECKKEIEHKKLQKEGEEKTSCQKQAYMTYGDELLRKEEKVIKDIERKNSLADFYNKQSFASLGINSTQFAPEEKETPEMIEKKRQEHAKKINSKNELYSRYELTRLRQKYALSCQKEADKDISAYVEGLNNYCESLKRFEAIGEE